MKKKNLYILIFFGLFFLIYLLLAPRTVFNVPTSTVIVSSDGQLLGARLADDEQWRFPFNDTVPEKFKKCIITFEDRYFYWHLGFNPVSFARALYYNIKKGRIVSGGSTLSMQVIRLSRGHKKRTVFEKIIEVFLATRLELLYSKEKILAMYASYAPMGGNVVGLDAAAWRYYGRSPAQLSWAETATLAVLPNSPSLIFPGKSQEMLLKKRNSLLTQLKNRDIIDDIEFELALTEPLPGKPIPLPSLCPHLLDKVIKDGYSGQYMKTSIDYMLQSKVNEILLQHHKVLKGNEINNIAALVLDVNSGAALAYVGNVPDGTPTVEGIQVDIIQAMRSPGSLFKPVLFAAMLDEGRILPGSLVPDIPTQIGNYAPVNFNRTYDGAVPARNALSRSLNVPAVRMLMDYGIEKFNHILKKAGITSLTKSPSFYGLSIILGGSEASLWEMCGMYASMARNLNFYNENNKYNAEAFFQPHYIFNNSKGKVKRSNRSYLFSAGTIWTMFNAIVDVVRPEEDNQWRMFSSSSKIAWKTGTSFGYRDGWAIGCTPEYVVGVWTGNASGEGRPGLVGLYTAAPVMFDIFKYLNPQKWFKAPQSNLVQMEICRHSGYKAGDLCSEKIKVNLPVNSLESPVCPFHIRVHLDASGNYRVSSDCEDVSNIQTVPWFVLPPVQESYFKEKNAFYKTLPPYRSDCMPASTLKTMAFVYPEPNARIQIPKELDGSIGKMVIKVVHRDPNAILYWHLNGNFIATTTRFHHQSIAPQSGSYVIEVVDNKGDRIRRRFEIINPE
ncbi:MAG: penicillin-binding protein 1C [Bacteroidales bacterium]|nr:penicillin-binding protein 1C [Bacteroidales bacterium]